MHFSALYTLSVLQGLAKSPSVEAVKALKHLLCWLYMHRKKGVRYGGGGNTSLVNPPHEEMMKMLDTPDGGVPKALFFFADSDLGEISRYCAYAFLNGAPIWGKSKKQHSIAIDITDAESFAYSVAAVMAEVLRGRLEDTGFMHAILAATLICTDNDATMRIASDAASAKRALFILRRLGHTRHLTELDSEVTRHPTAATRPTVTTVGRTRDVLPPCSNVQARSH